ncbi:MAG: 50S ribosomal protein L17 [Candidatus Latescibacterota bacterium]|nr:MAG: 50S ribosomal protein L17 [Candidatus Latescibacterota bacterium]
MRHRVDHRKLGRTRSHRKAMLANMVTSLFDKERIQTTDAKAKEARRQAERLITRAKKGYTAYQEHQSLKEAGKDVESKQMQAEALAHWRVASRVVRNRAVLKKLFDKIAPLYMERDGGYTRILRVATRQGDNAKTVLLELVGTEITREPARKKKKKAEAEETEKTKAKEKEKKTAKTKKAKKAEEKVEAEEAEKEAKVAKEDTESPEAEEAETKEASEEDK